MNYPKFKKGDILIISQSYKSFLKRKGAIIEYDYPELLIERLEVVDLILNKYGYLDDDYYRLIEQTTSKYKNIGMSYAHTVYDIDIKEMRKLKLEKLNRDKSI